MARVSQTNLRDQGRSAAMRVKNSFAEQELNGTDAGEDAMTDEEGDGVQGEAEAGTADWRVRAGSRNTPTARERKNTRQHTCHRAIGALTA